MTTKTFEGVRSLKLLGTGALSITGQFTIDGDIAHADKSADGVLTITVGDPPTVSTSGRHGGSNYISGGNISNVSQGNVYGFGDLFTSSTIISSGGGISLSGTTARSGSRAVTFGSKKLEILAPPTDTLVINGVRFRVGDLMSGAVPAPVVEAPRNVYKLSAERTRINTITSDDGVMLVIDNRSVLDETLRVSLSNAARVSLAQRFRFAKLRVRVSDAARFDGGESRVAEADIIASDAAHVSQIVVTREGEAEASDAASVNIAQVGRNLVRQRRTDVASLTVVTAAADNESEVRADKKQKKRKQDEAL